VTELSSAAEYHRRTRYRRGELGGGLDWANQPSVYKKYPQTESVPFPRDLVLPKADARQTLTGELVRASQPPSLSLLADLLFLAYGFSARVEHGPETFLYRSAPSAGALYPTEIYLTTQGIEGLDDGLYHYDIMDFALERLASGRPPGQVPAPALVLSGLFFRSAWKYRDRALRYCLLDAGHVAENLVLVSRVLGCSGEFLSNFDDQVLNAYLGFDPDREAALGLFRLKAGNSFSEHEATAPPNRPRSQPIAPREQVFDLVSEAVRLTSGPLTENPVEEWPRPQVDLVSLPASDWQGFEGPTLVQALQSRRSRRNFRPQRVTLQETARLLDLIVSPDAGRLVNLGLVTNEVQGLPDGFYGLHPEPRALIRRKGGFLSPALAEAALDQEWVGRANLILVLTSPLEYLEKTMGPRALRLSYLAAGRLGQRAYLAAETLGWGCCGVGAFFDEEVNRLLQLPPGEEVLYLVPLGPIKKRTHGGRPRPR